MSNKIIILVIAVVFVIFGFFWISKDQTRDNARPSMKGVEEDMSGDISPDISSPTPHQEVDDSVPSGLSLPFSTNDIDEFNGEINPLGIVRFSKDLGRVGHPGIDVPLFEGAQVLAVSDGEVVIIESAEDPWGGEEIVQLLKQTSPGEGWGYSYEHVSPTSDIVVGKKVKRGDVIAIKTAPSGFTAHFQISRLFNNFRYSKDARCWSNLLLPQDKLAFDDWWNEYRQSDHLINSWNTTLEEGQYPFRGLLDITMYPSGPQLCYPPGTDVR